MVLVAQSFMTNLSQFYFRHNYALNSGEHGTRLKDETLTLQLKLKLLLVVFVCVIEIS